MVNIPVPDGYSDDDSGDDSDGADSSTDSSSSSPTRTSRVSRRARDRQQVDDAPQEDAAEVNRATPDPRVERRPRRALEAEQEAVMETEDIRTRTQAADRFRDQRAKERARQQIAEQNPGVEPEDINSVERSQTDQQPDALRVDELGGVYSDPSKRRAAETIAAQSELDVADLLMWSGRTTTASSPS